LLSWSNEAATFSFFFSALLGYASLLSLIFFGDKITWLGKVLKILWNISLSSLTKAIITSFILLAVCLLFGFILYDKWETTKYNTVFEIDSKKNNIPNDAAMQVENIHTQEIYISTIEPNGRGRFRADKDSVVQVSTNLNGVQYVFQPIAIGKIPFYKSLDLNNAEKLKDKTVGVTLKSNVSTFTLPQSYFRQFNKDFNLESKYIQKTQHVKYGLPGRTNIIEKSGYIFSFNKVLRVPNWVGYWLNGRSKEIERPSRFVSEPLIDVSLQALSDDYRGSGYDRGHLVSISDMKHLGGKEVKEANSMATVVPQSRYLNRKTWVALEKVGRIYAENGVGIIAGPIFQGKNNNVQLITIGDNDVGVPTHLFRIIYRVKPGSLIETLPFIVPNSDDVTNDITEYLVSVDAIEELTGLDFFNELDSKVEKQIESIVPTTIWPAR